ncbi:hypothetical protein XENOCAPTIV_014009 [Xenoophorus captivus]|uniref:Uncharacterized protein n=1 Tax=Xenoophorus captivus TaxID=1517983 RepID=A0ABV0SH81_9TELE
MRRTLQAAHSITAGSGLSFIPFSVPSSETQQSAVLTCVWTKMSDELLRWIGLVLSTGNVPFKDLLFGLSESSLTVLDFISWPHEYMIQPSELDRLTKLEPLLGFCLDHLRNVATFKTFVTQMCSITEGPVGATMAS